MAYTIPEYVDTPEQAILAVASAVKGEQVTGGDGNVGTALDILADALAGENVTVPMTQQGAILALAQYVAGMVKPDGTITITENGEDIDVAQYATANVSVSGGGGDFTTASVVFVNDATVDDYTVPCPNVYEGDLFCDIDSGDMDGETPFEVVLYGGKLDVRLPMDVEIKVASVSGSIEIDGSSICITGDGTVTYEDA